MSENIIAFPVTKAAPDVTSQDDMLEMLEKYMVLAEQGKISSLVIISTSQDWRHGLEMLADDGDASDLATSLEIAKQRCLRKIGD